MTETTVGRSATSRRAPTTGEQPLPARRPVRVEGNVAAVPPPRPPLTSELSPPVPQPAPPRPRALRTAAVLWWGAGLAAVLTVVGAVLDREALDARLTALALESDPAAPADVVADGVRATLLLVLGSWVLLVALSLVWSALVLRRRRWARWALVATALPALFVADLAQSTVSGGAELDRIAALTGAGLVVAALVLVWFPSSRRWLRTPAA